MAAWDPMADPAENRNEGWGLAVVNGQFMPMRVAAVEQGVRRPVAVEQGMPMHAAGQPVRRRAARIRDPVVAPPPIALQPPLGVLHTTEINNPLREYLLSMYDGVADYNNKPQLPYPWYFRLFFPEAQVWICQPVLRIWELIVILRDEGISPIIVEDLTHSDDGLAIYSFRFMLNPVADVLARLHEDYHVWKYDDYRLAVCPKTEIAMHEYRWNRRFDDLRNAGVTSTVNPLIMDASSVDDLLFRLIRRINPHISAVTIIINWMDQNPPESSIPLKEYRKLFKRDTRYDVNCSAFTGIFQAKYPDHV